jgi:hypothetical protein
LIARGGAGAHRCALETAPAEDVLSTLQAVATDLKV